MLQHKILYWDLYFLGPLICKVHQACVCACMCAWILKLNLNNFFFWTIQLILMKLCKLVYKKCHLNIAKIQPWFKCKVTMTESDKPKDLGSPNCIYVISMLSFTTFENRFDPGLVPSHIDSLCKILKLTSFHKPKSL